MTGRELYELWSRKMNENGVSVDEWEDLEEAGKKAWRSLAVELLGGAA